MLLCHYKKGNNYVQIVTLQRGEDILTCYKNFYLVKEDMENLDKEGTTIQSQKGTSG